MCFISKTSQTPTLWTVCGQVSTVNMGTCLKNSFRKVICEENIAKRTQDRALWDTNINWQEGGSRSINVHSLTSTRKIVLHPSKGHFIKTIQLQLAQHDAMVHKIKSSRHVHLVS